MSTVINRSITYFKRHLSYFPMGLMISPLGLEQRGESARYLERMGLRKGLYVTLSR